MTKSNSIMAVLTMTAILMLAVLLCTNSQQAQATMLYPQQDYVLLTAGVPAGDEMLFVVDKVGQKVMAYRWNGAPNNERLELVAWESYGKQFTK